MARVALFSATALALVATAFGHARLVVPAPWNPNPTKSAPCGGSTELAATATWVQGSTVTIQWQLIAPDGAGSVILTLDPLGTANPANLNAGSEVQIFTPPTNASDLTTYSYQYQVPIVTCPSTGCTMQVASAGWVSCATVNIVSATAGATSSNAALATSCVTASGLSFCTMMNGYSVIIPTSSNVAELDTQASNSYNANLGNPLVFGTPSNAACQTDYKAFLCYSTFPLCGTTNSVCQDACSSMVAACDLLPAHANLYNCANYATSSCTDAAAVTPCCTPGQGFGIFLLVALIVSLVGFIGAMVYWRANNRPKYDAVMAKPGQWSTAIKSKFGY